MASARSFAEIVSQRIASGGTPLPVFDPVAARLQRMLSQGEFDMNQVERLVARDPGLTSSLLRMANSAFFRGLEKCVTVRDAVLRLGSRQVANTVIMASQKAHYRSRIPWVQKLMTRLWQHSVVCALAARWIAQRAKLDDGDEAFLAGLLHDVGKLFLLRVVDDLVRQNPEFRPSETLVLQVLHGMHAEQGARLLASWNLPESYQVVAREHHAEDFDESNVVLAVVRLADQTCRKLGHALEANRTLVPAALPEAHVLRLSEVALAELEVVLEDATQVAS